MTPEVNFNLKPKRDVGLDGQRLFRSLVPPDLLDQKLPSAPQAVYTTSVTVWMMLFQRLHGAASLDDAVSAFLFLFPREDLPDCKRVRDGNLSADNGTYTKARQRLPLGFVDWLADHVYSSLAAGSQPSWKGRHVDILDGTTFSLAPSAELRLAFPPPSNQHGPSAWPSLRAVVAHDLATGLTCRPEYGPAYGDDNECESVLTRRLLERLRPGSILLGDGNFGIFILAYEAKQTNHDVLLRLSGPRFEALRREATDLGDGRWAVTWRPSKQERRKYPELPADAQVGGFLCEYEISTRKGPEALYLFATLSEGSNQEWAELYRRRWEVEPDIAASKVTLGLGQMAALTKEMIEKEVVLASVAYNLVVSVRHQAATKAKVDPRRLSFKGTLSLLKAYEARLAAGGLSEEEAQELFEKLLRAVGQRKLPNRPGRSYPREVLPRGRRYPTRKRSPPASATAPESIAK
jgi:hypothetical protein